MNLYTVILCYTIYIYILCIIMYTGIFFGPVGASQVALSSRYALSVLLSAWSSTFQGEKSQHQHRSCIAQRLGVKQ